MAKQSNLKYKISDAGMYEDAKLKRIFFIEDKPDFITFDGDFADPFAADMLTQIGVAEALPSDETLNDQGGQLTVEVEKQMEKCRKKFQDAKYFIEKTFPDNQKVWDEFGYDDYAGVRTVQPLMIEFMKNFHIIATKYKVDLIANGYAQPKIDEINTLCTALDDTNNTQNAFLKNIPVQTQARYAANNTVWDRMVLICTAGKRIFIDNYGKYQRYLLPPGEENLQALSISGTVTDQANGNPLEGALVKITSLGIDTTTDANGKYEIGGLPDDTYALDFSVASYVTKTVNASVAGGVGLVVNVQMTHV